MLTLHRGAADHDGRVPTKRPAFARTFPPAGGLRPGRAANGPAAPRSMISTSRQAPTESGAADLPPLVRYAAAGTASCRNKCRHRVRAGRRALVARPRTRSELLRRAAHRAHGL